MGPGDNSIVDIDWEQWRHLFVKCDHGVPGGRNCFECLVKLTAEAYAPTLDPLEEQDR